MTVNERCPSGTDLCRPIVGRLVLCKIRPSLRPAGFGPGCFTGLPRRRAWSPQVLLAFVFLLFVSAVSMPQGGVSPSGRPETVPDFSLTFIPVSRGGDNDPFRPCGRRDGPCASFGKKCGASAGDGASIPTKGRRGWRITANGRTKPFTCG